MRVAFLGRVSDVETFTDKKTGFPVKNVFVSSKNQMMKIRVEPEVHFEELDAVMVAGDLKVYERNFYVENPVIRLATPEDKAFMEGTPVGAASGAGAGAAGAAVETTGRKSEKAV